MAVTLAKARLGGNHMLRHLSNEHFVALCLMFDQVHRSIKQGLHERSAPTLYVYFPSNATLTNMVFFNDGAAVEVGTVGKEGFNAVELLAWASATTETSIC